MNNGNITGRFLPAVGSHIVRRPDANARPGQWVPDDRDGGFWTDFFGRIAASDRLDEAVGGQDACVNPYFGHYGLRWHPVAGRPQYYHIGIDVNVPEGTPIRAVGDGLLEYSGYAEVNGNYIELRHPSFRTEDGFELHSLYLHCQSVGVQFSLMQKLVREYVSRSRLDANVAVCRGQVIATVGGTGHRDGLVPHLHLQFELVRDRGRGRSRDRVAVPPLALYGLPCPENRTADIRDREEYLSFFRSNREELAPWRRFAFG